MSFPSGSSVSGLLPNSGCGEWPRFPLPLPSKMKRPTSISWQISQSAEIIAMVEILLSLLLLIAAIALAIGPYAVIHDHTIDGRFLTLTGFMLTLLFLRNF